VYPEEERLLTGLAVLEGILLDASYTGKAFVALARAAADGRISPRDRVLFIHTGGIFGLLGDNGVAEGVTKACIS
jgi:D-cysteine desulfhydrase